jgi:hypothetical protein
MVRRVSVCLLAVAFLAALVLGVAQATAQVAATTKTTLSPLGPINVMQGSPISATATVASQSGVPVGSLDFLLTNTVSGATLDYSGFLVPVDANSAKATLTGIGGTAVVAPPGSYTLTASFSPDDFTAFMPSTSAPTSVTVGQVVVHPTNVQVTSSPDSPTSGGFATFTVQVTQADGGSGTPTGTVTLSASGTTLTSIAHPDGIVPLVGGSATEIVGGWTTPGIYSIVARYSGDDTNAANSGSVSFTIAPSKELFATTTTVSASVGGVTFDGSSPISIVENSDVVLIAHVVQTGAPTSPPGGAQQVDFRSSSIFGQNVELGPADLSPDGYATLHPPANWGPATYKITATYIGSVDQGFAGSKGTLNFGVFAHDASATTLTPDAATITVGDAAQLSATLASAGAPVSGQLIQLSVNGNNDESCFATTQAEGGASCTTPLTADAHGVYPTGVQASFPGSGSYAGSSGTAALTIVGLPSSLTFVDPGPVAPSSSPTIAYKLTDNGANGLGGETVTATFNGQPLGSAITNASGIATWTISTPSTLGTYPTSASFGGDARYDASDANGLVSVTVIPTTTTVSANAATSTGYPATLNGKLVSANGPISGESVTLSFGSTLVDSCAGVTQADGTVSCTVAAVTNAPGTYTVTGTFAGDQGAALLGSSGTGSIAVGPGVTAIVDNVSGKYVLGSSVTLSGTLTVNGHGLAGQTVTLALGAASCPATTDASGNASCSVTAAAPTALTTTTASFAGSTSYVASSSSLPSLVYAFAPGGGAFVIGDKSATGSVTFWGAQWSKSNALSQGGSVPSFKGFAPSPSTPACGTAWAADPGNSSPPPNGPLPAYMAVVVASQTSKSGNKISGNTVHIVVVKTNPGYDSNPGHAGTGTVVATIC